MSIKIENSSSSDLEALSTPRSTTQAMLRGANQTCPACGRGRLFRTYLKVSDHCADCGEAMHHQRADDAPPYFTMFIVGHFAVGGVLALEQAYKPSPWVHAAIWLPLVLISSLWLLPRVKGALIGLQWALRMHGFGSARANEPLITEQSAPVSTSNSTTAP